MKDRSEPINQADHPPCVDCLSAFLFVLDGQEVFGIVVAQHDDVLDCSLIVVWDVFCGVSFSEESQAGKSLTATERGHLYRLVSHRSYETSQTAHDPIVPLD